MAKAYLEIEDIERLENATDFLSDKLLIRLLFHAAGRVSEVIALEVPNIDFEQGTITIPHLKQRIALACPVCGARLGRGHSFCPKCGTKVTQAISKQQEERRVRTVPLDKVTLGMLRDYIQRGGPVEKNGKKFIFGITRTRAYQIIRECARQARLPPLVNPETGKLRGISPHRLRDAFATHAMKIDDSGDGQRKLQEFLGHENFNTTARYRKISGEEQKQWYDNVLKKMETNNHGSDQAQ